MVNPFPVQPSNPMLALTNMQRTLVEHYVNHGSSKADAITAANYAHASAGYNAFQSERVVAAVEWLVKRRMSSLAPRALNQVALLSGGAKSEKVRLEASQDLLNRGGFSAEPAAGLSLNAMQVNIKIDLG